MSRFEEYCQISEIERRFSTNCLVNVVSRVADKFGDEVSSQERSQITNSILTVINAHKAILSCAECQVRCTLTTETHSADLGEDEDYENVYFDFEQKNIS
jgi:hypothetical protein